MNDPCGYCYYKGVYHLFYQFMPENGLGLVWGHAVSVDNVNWIDLPAAVKPTIETCCCSGGALVEDDRVIVVYSGNLHGDDLNNCIHVLVSYDDLLLNWERTSELPTVYTLKENGEKNEYNAFDPCLYKDGDTYCMLTAGGGSLPHTHNLNNLDLRRHYLFTSKDLVNWDYRHVFVEDDIFNVKGDDGACPYFLPVGDKHMLLHFSHRQGGKYIVGDYDSESKKFYAKNGGAFNAHGWYSGVHAPSAFAENGAVISIFNMNYGFKTQGINQIMSIPRVITVNDDYSINEAPIPQLECMRGEYVSGETTAKANEDTVLDVNGDSLEMRVKISAAERKIEHNFIPDNLIPAVEVRVLRSPNTKEYVAIRFYRNRSAMDWNAYQNHSMHWANGSESVVEIDSSASSLSPDVAHHPTEHQSFFLNCDEDIDLRIFVDKSIVEVFANGKRCVSARCYPTLSESKGVSVLSRGIDVNVKYEAWEMKKIDY
jgi:beta-fructofuranosidase